MLLIISIFESVDSITISTISILLSILHSFEIKKSDCESAVSIKTSMVEIDSLIKSILLDMVHILCNNALNAVNVPATSVIIKLDTSSTVSSRTNNLF